MDREASNEHLSDIFTLFGNHLDFTLVPMNSAFYIDDVIKNYLLLKIMCLQNADLSAFIICLVLTQK